jgi:hypothetical protein
MLEYQFWFGILALLLAFYSAYHQTKQTNLMASQAASRAERRRGEIPRLIWWRSPAILALFALACLVWGPYILSKIHEEERLLNSVAGIRTVTVDNSTGKLKDVGLYVSVDGNEIYKYSPWRVMAAAFVWTSDRDADDVQDLQKSTILDIRKETMQFWFKGNPKFIEQVGKGAPVNFAVIVLPKTISANNFETLRQARDWGAKIIRLGSESH